MKIIANVNSLLKGFIKIVHPDLFANASKPIQTANLNCVKSLNEVLDFADKIENSLNNKRQFDISNPLSVKYDIPCYANNPMLGLSSDSGEPTDDSKLSPYIKTKFQLYAPINFTTKQTFSNSHQLELSTKELYVRLIDSFYYAGFREHRLIDGNPHHRQSMAERAYLLENNLVETPLQIHEQNLGRSRSGFGSYGSSTGEANLSKAEEEKFYQQSYGRWITLEVQAQARRRAARLHSFSKQRMRATSDSFDDDTNNDDDFPGSFLMPSSSSPLPSKRGASSKKKRSRLNSSNSNTGNISGRGYNAMSEDVDIYIANGNVLINTGAKVDNSDAGTIDNRRIDREDIGDAASTDRVRSKSSDRMGPLGEGHNLAAQERLLAPLRQFILDYGDVIHFNVVDYRCVIMCLHQTKVQESSWVESAATAPDIEHKKIPPPPTSFALTKHGEHYVLDIPCPFRPKALLRFIQDELPVANILFQAGAVAPEGFDLGSR